MRDMKEKLLNIARFFYLFRTDVNSMMKYFSLKGKDKYAFFQKYYYNRHAEKTNYTQETKKDDGVVGTYEQHNYWPDYDIYLMKNIDDSYKDKIALDFACGPGRNIVQYHKKFKRIDGVDISETLIERAKENLQYHKIELPNLYSNNGFDLAMIKDNTYDFILSTIAMQHICVHEIRYNLFNEMFRILKPNGRISFQMGYGKYSPYTVGYFENNYLALNTNRGCDTRIEAPDQVQGDLEKIGFKNFTYDIRPTGPGDSHPAWIFFQATK